MEQQNEHGPIPLPNTNPLGPDARETSGAQRIRLSDSYSLGLFAALILSTGTLYGFLASSDSSQTVQPLHVAAVAEAIPNAFESLTLEAQSAFVVDLSENKIVHAKNADVQLPLASITKVMLVLAVSDVLSAEDTITISEMAVIRGEGGGPAAGEIWRVKDLIDYTLVASSNVGAEALAEAANEKVRLRYPQAPEEGATVWRMNSFAKELGLTKTYFLNASGLDVSLTQPSAMGSARDATILLAYAYKTLPLTFAATKQSTLTTGPLAGPIFVSENTNDVIAQIPDLKMGKTGFTDLAGGNLSVVYEAPPGHTFVATVLGSSQSGRFTDILSISAAARQ